MWASKDLCPAGCWQLPVPVLWATWGLLGYLSSSTLGFSPFAQQQELQVEIRGWGIEGTDSLQLLECCVALGS